MVPSLMRLMLKELQPYMFFPHWETVSKNQKRGVREQVCLDTCLGFISCPERIPKHCPSTGAPMSICSSESPFLWEEDSSTSIPPSFSLQSCLCVPLYSAYSSGQGVVRLEPWLLLPPCPWSFTLVLLVALDQEPHFPLCSPSNAQQVGHGQRDCEKGGRLKVTLPFPFCRAEWGLWHPIPAGSLPPAVNRHWAHTLAASSACWIAAAIRPAQ